MKDITEEFVAAKMNDFFKSHDLTEKEQEMFYEILINGCVIIDKKGDIVKDNPFDLLEKAATDTDMKNIGIVGHAGFGSIFAQQPLSKEEMAAEMERCKDPVYFYNKYQRKEGEPEITQEIYEELRYQSEVHFAHRNKVKEFSASNLSFDLPIIMQPKSETKRIGNNKKHKKRRRK